MLEYAYRLQGIHLPPDLVHTDSLQHFYEQLANVLAKRIIDRSRRGLYRTYRPEDERLPYIRGRIDLARASRSPWDTKLHCQYEDHTADVDDNRILAWTLWRIVRSGYCTERVLPTVRRAFRILQSAQHWNRTHQTVVSAVPIIGSIRTINRCTPSAVSF